MTFSVLPANQAASLISLDAVPAGLTTAQVAMSADIALSSAQRALEDLKAAGVLCRDGAQYRFSASYPHRELVAVAAHDVGESAANRLVRRAKFAAANIPRSTRRRISELSVSDDVRLGLAVAVERLVQEVHPRSVVVFGSQARGTARPDSDVDLLVVEDDVPDRQSATIKALRLLNGIGVAKDVLVASPGIIATAVPGSVTATAVAEGVKIYERR